MKRYKKLSTTLPDLQSEPYTVIVVDNEMCENPKGEWVRYEDIKHLRPNLSLCEYTEEMLGDAQFQISRITEIYEKRIRELKDQIGNDPKTHLQPGIKTPECNCAERAASCTHNPLHTWWVCPAHGYKKR